MFLIRYSSDKIFSNVCAYESTVMQKTSVHKLNIFKINRSKKNNELKEKTNLKLTRN